MVYCAIVTFLYQTTRYLWAGPEPVLPKDPKPQESHKVKDDGIYNDFPWYKTQHRRPQFQSNFTTSHLTTAERRQLHTAAIARAKTHALEMLGVIEGISGTKYQTQEEAERFRSLVDCWTQGRWEHTPGFRLTHRQDAVFGSCDKKFYKTHESSELREAVKYSWAPSSSCALRKVDSGRWCELLRGRHMLLVGDLVHYQLHDLLLDALRDGPTECFGELNCKGSKRKKLLLNPEARLRFLRNDVLSTARRVEKAGGHPSVDIIQWPFVTSNILKAYPILILNRSPVVEDDETFLHDLSWTMKTIRRTVPDALVIYRSSSIGHPYCDDATTPMPSHLADDQLRRLPYGWSELNRRNAIARAVVEAAGGLFVDLAALTDVRPDGHVGGQDCLRYCIPGPTDAWIHVLYNVFLGLESKVY
ncbi:hypothetical protein DFQ28_007559 [Apophysomyces sp. BC1034]|nr:hypothetical protein DFQ30_003183 [Apophysomyces sp. BC1015]KAG0182142.1 hypothetical protein DFQ29_005502 [Apophysomyces sp. BC1021]KAG0192799.1 hypothetical protein DFQ28_007559 [Apophysomyces sp. BC1034]